MKNFKLPNIGHPEKFRARIKMRAITFFFISLCNLVGYWPIYGLKLIYYSINRTLNVIIGGCNNSKFLRGRPEKFRASIRIRVVTFFFIYLCNLVGYWPICELIEPNIRYLKNHKWILFTVVFGVKECHGIVFFKIRGQFNPLLTHQGTLWPFKLHFCP